MSITISAQEVNRLRKATGIGMMDCKHALVEAEGDFDKAIDILRKKGQKVAAKRADRSANEGRVIAKVNADSTKGYILVLSCETDFVGKNDEFVALSEKLINEAMNKNLNTRDELLALTINGMTVPEMLLELTGKTGEKIELPDFKVIEAAHVTAYNHLGNRLAAIAGFNIPGHEDTAHEVALQIAAMNPVALSAETLPKETIEHELEIARDTTRQEGKPEKMVEQIAQGKLNKFFKENTLLAQEYYADNKMNVADFMKKADPNMTCTGFFRLQLGA
ncbi:MAG: elongation factor Ts [Bacteroidales bacterium]|nr:elongation factor Ts [Bacteroidales bacterium]MDD6581705.1 translation elongation factor Ts [Bacteroidales bacterium]